MNYKLSQNNNNKKKWIRKYLGFCQRWNDRIYSTAQLRSFPDKVVGFEVDLDEAVGNN